MQKLHNLHFERLFLFILLGVFLFSCSVTKKEIADNALFLNKRILIPAIGPKQDTLHVTFNYRNTTSCKIRITQIRTSRGCMKVEVPQKDICKNDSGYIDVAIDISKVQGMFHQELLVYTDKLTPILLSVKGFKKSN